ncbi:hypothetical protein V8E53_008755 [Lactarius tabidus]
MRVVLAHALRQLKDPGAEAVRGAAEPPQLERASNEYYHVPHVVMNLNYHEKKPYNCGTGRPSQRHGRVTCAAHTAERNSLPLERTSSHASIQFAIPEPKSRPNTVKVYTSQVYTFDWNNKDTYCRLNYYRSLGFAKKVLNIFHTLNNTSDFSFFIIKWCRSAADDQVFMHFCKLFVTRCHTFGSSRHFGICGGHARRRKSCLSGD